VTKRGDVATVSTAMARIRVMTRNVYIGTGLAPVFRTHDAARIPEAVGALWREVQASDPPERLARIADEIADTLPDLVALQEAARYEMRPALGGGDASTIDFVALLSAALAARGLGYAVAVSQENFDLELPDDAGRLVRFTDRDVVLARDGVATRDARVHRYAAAVEYAAGGFSLAMPRGWIGVEADVGGRRVWLVNTHVEHAGEGRVQEEQVRELLALLAGEQRETILAGDLNSSADAGGASYRMLRDAGFEDAWAVARAGEPGPTCCYSSDLRGGALGVRFDLVLYRGTLAVESAERVGAASAGRTPSGRWPSDHAGVVATFH
jgi:endonuclease/exonuclease/phosphatase family metal-dependent hydrolase